MLFKMLASGSFTYQGDDQTEYTDDFSQVNLIGSQDLQPVISFLQWLDEASDEEFAAGLDERLDVEGFAEYLAFQELIGNIDTISGPGRNGYLSYDLGTGRISVISWDLNLAFGGMGAGPGVRAGEQVTADDGEATDAESSAAASPPAGEMPDMAGMMGGENALVTRFQENSEFAALIESAKARLQKSLIASGDALGVVEEVAARIPVTEGLPQSTVDADADALREQLAAAE